MDQRRWTEDLKRMYANWWLAPEARERPSRRPDRSGWWRQPPGWLLALAPFALVAAAVAVLVIAIIAR
jgi:hypothetical protein